MVAVPQEVKNWLLGKHHAHALEFQRKYSRRKITSFNLFELLNSSDISVRNDKHMFGGSCLCGCGTERPDSRSFFTFLRAVMFRLFTFGFTFVWVTFIAMISRTRELIFHQFALPLLSDHFDAVSRSNLLPLRELVERSNCQEVRSGTIDDGLRLSLRAHVAHCRVFLEIVCSLWCVASFTLLFFVLTMGVVLFLDWRDCLLVWAYKTS